MPTKVQTGNITRLYEYDAYGYPLRRTGKTDQLTYQNFTYTFDTSRQNLRTRTDQRSGKTETFNYDGMNRLTGDGTSVLEYAPNGNIIKKSDVGSYTYEMPGKPHAVTGIAPEGNLTSGMGTQEIFYTKALRPDSIHEGAFDAKFVYNGNLDKVKMTVTQDKGRSYLRKYYLGGCYELEESSFGPLRERLYLGGDYYDAPVMWEKTGSLTQCYSLLRDYLGSITHVVRFDGYLTKELNHDAWGIRRNPISYSPEVRPTTLLASTFSRGFCGHEYLDVFGLVDMNARLYDPILGRFLSPDPYMQIPDFSQGFNRYAYCMNNPLAYVDENGENPLFIIGIAALIGGTANLSWKAINGQIDDFGDAVSAFGIGAAAGGFGAAAGFVAAPMVGAGFLGGFVESAFSGVVSSSILSVGNSQAFGDPQMGWKGYVLSAIGAGVIGGVVNGGVAASQGKNFWTGAKKTISNRDLIQQAADMAYKEIPGEGPVVGTKRHKFASDYLKEYQIQHGDRQIKTNVYFIDKKTGAKGIIDIVDYKNEIIYDFKFGYPNKTPEMLNNTRQMQWYRKNMNNWPSFIIKPKIKY